MSITQMKTDKKKIRASIEETAEQLVMADLSDSSVLEKISETLTEISKDLNSYYPRCSKAALASANLLKESVRNEESLTDSSLKAIEDTICSLQQLFNQDLKDHDIDFPELFGLPTPIADDDGFDKKGFKIPTPGIDQEIMDEYLAHQELVVSEMEDLILSYEQDPGSDILKELKRLLHTAKGEAGVIGLNRIEKVCHRVEDYIQETETNLQADLLLEFKDWFEQIILAIKNRTRLPEEENLLRALQTRVENDEDVRKLIKEKQECVQKTETVKDEFLDLLNPVSIEDPEITSEFISETNDHFEISDENLIILEKDPENEEAIASIFRAFHTIKGTTSFLGLTPLSELAHKAENLLDEVRKKRLSFKGRVVDATFNAFDLLKTMIKQLEEALLSGKEFIPDPGLPEVLVQLKEVISGENSLPNSKKNHSTLISKENEKTKKHLTEVCIAEEESGEDQSGNLAANSGLLTQSGKTVKQTMKIDADRIDLLLETIGELVIMESIVSRDATMRQNEFRDMDRNLAQLTKITRSLQDMSMSMRLIPIDTTFRKMSRLVRDLSKKTGKKIELIMEGKDTELDKSMVEKLGDPLVHMIRNAVDHGIEETAEQRIAEGKDPVGKITLKAYHQGGNIHIDITDDGRGLEKGIITAKAIERGIVKGTENMTDEDIFSLIFEPGFSTAKQVTDVSGRGVGMDVVKNNIESVRGNVRIVSEPGKGSTFTLVLPLTMAIIDGMIVRVGSERYILPLLSIIESFQPKKKMIATVSGKGEMVPFRDRLLPLFRLADLYDIMDAQTDPTKALVVVIEDTGRRIALLVDELLGQNQTVIKNLGEGLGEVEGIAGASIMPDGKPGLIIDVNGLIKLANA
jgi:two-component system, chemotaxis family, sensor kinase CheA